MRNCDNCFFRDLHCVGTEAEFILEVLIRVRPEIGTYCALFDSSRIEAYRQVQEHLGVELEKPGDYGKKYFVGSSPTPEDGLIS